VSYFICSDDFLISRKNLFEFENFSKYIFTKNYFDRQRTPKTNLNKQNTTLFVDNERIQFPKGKQKEFIKYAKKSSNLTWIDFAKKLEIKYNTIQNIFKENYRISQGKNKSYYPTIRLTTISKQLSKDVSEILKMLGFNICIYTNTKLTKRTPNPRFKIILYGYNNFTRYMELIRTKQPKNIDKINKWRNNWPNLG
jgi:hypothetical protein